MYIKYTKVVKPKFYMDSFLPTLIETFLSTNLKNKAQNKQKVKSRNFVGHRSVNFRIRFLFNSLGFWAQFQKEKLDRVGNVHY